MQRQLCTPPREHQRGKGKLLGEYFGDFLRQSFSEEFENFDGLDEFLTSLRAYIVLDDFLFDKYCDSLTEEELRTECLSTLLRCRAILEGNGFQPNIIETSLQIIEMGKRSFSLVTPVASVLQKCWFVFTPLMIVRDDNPGKAKVLSFLKEYLALLQIVDDFQDIEEDRNSPQNHNLFDANATLRRFPSVNVQIALLEEVLLLGRSKCDEWVRTGPHSTVAQSFICYGVQYFDRLLSTIGGETRAPQLLDTDYVGTGSLFQPSVRAEDVHRLGQKLQLADLARTESVVNLVRAEQLHRRQH